jgi:hypothetical protein
MQFGYPGVYVGEAPSDLAYESLAREDDPLP